MSSNRRKLHNKNDKNQTSLKQNKKIGKPQTKYEIKEKLGGETLNQSKKKDCGKSLDPFDDLERVHEAYSDEDVKYLVNFDKVKDKLRIIVKEVESFPPNIYENYFSIEDLIKISPWFKIFYNMDSLLLELETLSKNEHFITKVIREELLSLFIVFPIELLDRIELPLIRNEIDPQELLDQLLQNINEFEKKKEDDLNNFNINLKNLANLMSRKFGGPIELVEMSKNGLNENIGGKEIREINNIPNENIEGLNDEVQKEITNGDVMGFTKNRGDNFLVIDENKKPFLETTILKRKNQYLDCKELELLLEWLSPVLSFNQHNPRILRTTLVYKASEMGDKASSFHEKCDNLGPTIILIKTKEGYRYGGYTSVSWCSPENSEFISDPNAFIFSFDTQKKYVTLNPSKSIQCSMYWGPYFGEGGTICVPDNCFTETNAFHQWPSTYDLSEQDELTLGKEHYIHIEDYEVYTIDENPIQ